MEGAGAGGDAGKQSPLVEDEHEGAEGGCEVAEGECEPDAIELHGARKPQHQRYEEDYLTGQRQEYAFAGFADALEECRRDDLEAYEPECPEAMVEGIDSRVNQRL